MSDPQPNQDPVGVTAAMLDDGGPAIPTAAALTQAALPANVWETSFDDETVSSREYDTYKWRAKVTDRIGILNVKSIIVSRDHYKEGLGYIVCNSEYRKEGKIEICVKQAPCCEHMDPARKRITALVIKYNTDPEGRLLNPFGYTLLVWHFSPDKFDQLRNLHKEWGLEEHDLLVNCEEEKYQRLSFTVCKEAIHRKDAFLKPFGEQVATWLQAIKPKLAAAAGRKLSNADLLQKLGKGAAAPTIVAGRMDAPVAEIADLLK